ncbi:UPF0764 protein C16orf89 homolog [Penaeus chinensis]|uniref:UPF0764 protein C16orf89 homolog n=1 Tax=Penaeus chinensis TaxID=139456 RepID=UPI001FB6B51F|nr:UPF0764 protein C16orf89 homolog [Penaeus chinensis]
MLATANVLPVVTLLTGVTCGSYGSPVLPSMNILFDDQFPLLRKLPALYRQRDGQLMVPKEGRSPSVREGPQSDTQMLRKALDACWRVLWYYRGHVAQMNLDAVIGTRIAEAQFQMVSDALQDQLSTRKSEAMQDTLTSLLDLRDLASQVNTEAEPIVMASEPEYYGQLGKMLAKGFWEVPLDTRSVNTSAQRDILDPVSRRVLDETEQLLEFQSDKCLAEEFGTSCRLRGEGSGEECGRCSMSEECWSRMTRPGYSGYSLTHQAFYIIIGLQTGCGDQVHLLTRRTTGGGSVRGLLDRICADVLTEAQVISEASFPQNRRDLFMEQGALCGIAGYRDFFRRSWLEEVLSWQREPGCFGDSDVYTQRHSLPTPSPLHARVRREEKAMSSRCLAHQSAVALGYLSLCVRFLVSANFL